MATGPGDGRTRWGPAAWATTMLLLGAFGIASVLVLDPFGGDERCATLGSEVESLGPVAWDNGFTSSAPAWSVVLSDGITEARDDDRAEIAAAVAADADGYERFLAALDDEQAEAAAERLHALLLDPQAAADRADDPEVASDARAVTRPGLMDCSIA